MFKSKKKEIKEKKEPVKSPPKKKQNAFTVDMLREISNIIDVEVPF